VLLDLNLYSMKKLLLSAGVLTLFFITACQRQEVHDQSGPLSTELVRKDNIVKTPQGDPLSKSEVDALILGIIRERKDFHWDWLTLDQLWSVCQYGEQVVSVGYKPADVEDVNAIIDRIDIHSGAWKSVHDEVIKLVVDAVNANSASPVIAENIIVEDDQVLPIITFKLTDRDAIAQLYNLKNVRYIEPLGYWPDNDDTRSSSGCSGSTYAVNAADYSFTTPSCLVPWNYNNVNIPAAWGIAQGQGITIGVIDAGLSSAQPLLNAQFNSGDSNVGRTVSTDYTYGSSAFNTCTHGTSMCSTAAGPRNSVNATTGVAYKSNLHFIRACDDVVLDASSELTGTKNALVKMGNKADVRIVSMSIGTPFYSSTLYDGITYCYNKGKLICAAAGTSTSWLSWWGVIYPAAWSQCLAITGVKENSSTCSDCHDGSQVDFTIPMERDGNSNRNSLALPYSGTFPTYIGGSSVATSTAAGIAALVWSTKPTLSRTQVIACMTVTSQYYPGISSYDGYGNLNAYMACVAAQAQ
jgi:hypothetical protein